jgi:hypothetical protein
MSFRKILAREKSPAQQFIIRKATERAATGRGVAELPKNPFAFGFASSWILRFRGDSGRVEQRGHCRDADCES